MLSGDNADGEDMVIRVSAVPILAAGEAEVAEAGRAVPLQGVDSAALAGAAGALAAVARDQAGNK